MTTTPDLRGDHAAAHRATLAQLAARLEEEHEKVAAALDALPQSRLFVGVAPEVNSPGNLALHLGGNLRELAGRIAGDVAYSRDRPREFAAKGVPKAQVLAELKDGVDVALQVLARMADDPTAWNEPAPDAKFAGESRGDHVARAMLHFAYHAGQIRMEAKIHRMLGEAMGE